ncbi:MAG TPA: hypothetical protein ENJ90_01655 [Devosia sp.]|nr:hypothetical protein [Devosia sp.]
MTWETVLVVFVIVAHVVLVVLVFVSLLRGIGADPEVDTGGRKLLRLSRVLLWGGILLAIWTGLGLYIAVEALSGERVVASGVLVGLMLALFAGLMGGWTLARYLNFRIAWDDEAIEVTNWRGNTNRFRWGDLKTLSHRQGDNNVYGLVDPGQTEVRIFDMELRFENGGLVRAAPNLAGYPVFVRDAMRHWGEMQGASG